MAFLDSFGAKLSSLGNDVSNRTKSMVEANNLNGQLKICEEQLDNYYMEIGKSYYESKNGVADTEEMQEVFLKVKEAREAIDHLSSSLHRVKGTVPCPNCKAEMPADMIFCSACGTKMDGSMLGKEYEENQHEPDVICPKCMEHNRPGSTFCVGCGNKL